MPLDHLHTLQQEAGSYESPSENLGGLTFFDAFTDVHTPPECLPPVHIRRMLTPYAQSGLYMREAFRKAVNSLGLIKQS